MQLCEKYRPKTLNDIIGQPKAIEKVKRIIGKPDFDGDALWVVGPSGCGKTSLARILASMLSTRFDTIELDGDRCDVEAVHQLANLMPLVPMGGKLRCIIVNEAQAMTSRSVQAWLTALDPVPRGNLVIFTTTDESESIFGDYDGPFMRRCKQIAFTNQGLAKSVAPWLKSVAETEHLDGQPVERYVRLMQECRNNIGMAVQKIDEGEMLS